jgi:hypothetical protein
MTKEEETKLILDLAEDLAPFVKDVESGKIPKTTRNNYGAYGQMLTRLSRGKRRGAIILSYALLKAGANAQGVSDALQAFFPE